MADSYPTTPPATPPATATATAPSAAPDAPIGPAQWNPVAAVAAWVVPGLGHHLMGQTRRGLIVGSSILAIWVGGLLIGNVSVIDAGEHPLWFVAQVLLAPSLAVATLTPEAVTMGVDLEDSFLAMHDQGVLWTSLAGMMNLLAIIDVIYRHDRDPRYADARRDGGDPR